MKVIKGDKTSREALHQPPVLSWLQGSPVSEGAFRVWFWAEVLGIKRAWGGGGVYMPRRA